MDHRQIGLFIESQRRTLAESVVASQYELQPGLREKYGEAGRGKCIQDTEYHLSYLGAAVTFSSTALFEDYMRWAAAVMAAYGVGTEDVERNLICLSEVLKENLPDSARQTITRYCEAASKTLQESPIESTSFLEGGDSLSQLARQYLDALLDTDRYVACRTILNAAEAGVPVTDIYLQVLDRCQREIGRLWQSKRITIAQEHYCTAVTQLVMSQLYPYLLARPKSGRRLVAASVSGELHEIGLRVVADVFEAEGWEVIYLGANTPEESILQTIRQNRPELLVISATMSFNLAAVERLIALVRSSEVGHSVKIMVGGYPCNIDPNLWQQLGADGYACDVREALTTAERLVTLRGVQAAAETAPKKRSFTGTLPYGPKSPGEPAIHDELTRLNNDLLTTQRELARKNSELERLQKQLVQADRRKDEFIATLAHELRNPLATIRTALDLMRLSTDDPALLEDVRTIMESQSQHLTRLVDDLLDVSRITSGKISLQKVTVELNKIVKSAVDATDALIKEKAHEVTVMLPPQRIFVEADPVRITQIISNLLSNAARYTPIGGHIRLSVIQKEQDVIISVKDTGVGIPSEMLHRIFDIFTQVDHSTEQSRSGLGIGLMVVKQLAELHGGSVKAHSEGPGKGSEFVVQLPIVGTSNGEPKTNAIMPS